MMINRAQKFWDKQANRYDASEKQFDAVNQQIIAKTKEYLNPNDTVLDFGCATGTKTLLLGDGIKHIYGIDFSAEMINEAIKKKNNANADNVTFSQGTIFSNELAQASFDKIIAFAMVHLLEDSEKTIRRIHELLKPGGLFISTTACFGDKMAFITRLEVTTYLLLKRLGIFALHLNLFTTSGLEKLISNQHFKIIKADKMFNGMTFSFVVAEKS